MVRIRRTGVTPSELVLTDDILSRKENGRLRALEAVLVRFVAPVLQEEVTRNQLKILPESDGSTTESIDVDNDWADEQIRTGQGTTD